MQKINFFPGCTTVGEVKSLYRELAKVHHPSLGGDLETMKQLNIAYHLKLESLNGQTRQDDGKTYTYRYSSTVEQKIMDKLQEILKAGVGLAWEVEIVGLWVWVGNTARDDKNLLNKNGCKMRWHNKRQKWYWKPYRGKTRYSKKSMNHLRQAYGSQRFQTDQTGSAVAI